MSTLHLTIEATPIKSVERIKFETKVKEENNMKEKWPNKSQAVEEILEHLHEVKPPIVMACLLSLLDDLKVIKENHEFEMEKKRDKKILDQEFIDAINESNLEDEEPGIFCCRPEDYENMRAVTGKEIIESTEKIFREGRQRELYPYLFMTIIGPDGKPQSDPMEERSWKEDFDGENGRYMNKCCVCKENFIGHKRRVVCKKCKSKTTHPFTQADQST